MSGLFGGVLGNPHERVETTLRRELELRSNDPRTAAQFSGYAYRGGTDLVLRHGRFRPGRRIPEQYEHLIGRPSECTSNAAIAVETDPSLRYCEGYYTTGWGAPQVHAWCVAPDDGVVEVTIPTNREGITSAETHMKFLPPEHWGYWGVIFDVALVSDHGEKLSLPMLNRLPGEIARPVVAGFEIDRTEDHDFPVLKVPYDPNRKALP